MTRDPSIVPAWIRRIHDFSDGELFEIVANMITCLVSDLPTPTTENESEFHLMLVGLRNEALERYQNRHHHSAPPRGNG